MAASIGLKAPLMVDIAVRDYGSKSGLSSRREHYLDRFKCVPDLSALISPKKSEITLKVASSAVSRFISTRVTYETVTKSLQTTRHFESSTRLFLQRDVATILYPCEDSSIDGRIPTGTKAKELAMDATLTLRSGSFELFPLSWSATVQKISAPLSFNSSQKSPKTIVAEAISLFKLRRHDLYLIDKKDEQRGVILLDLIIEKVSTHSNQVCSLAIYYLPRFTEKWTSEMINFDIFKKSIETFGSNGFFIPIFTVGTMVLFDLNMLDTAFRRKSSRQDATPHNFTFAVFLNSNSNNESCKFYSSRSHIPPYFELIKYRRATPPNKIDMEKKISREYVA